MKKCVDRDSERRENVVTIDIDRVCE
jgi:hypothetical protein